LGQSSILSLLYFSFPTIVVHYNELYPFPIMKTHSAGFHMHKEEYDLPLSGYKAPAVQKAFRLVRTVAGAQDGMRIADLAALTGYSMSTTHGLVHALLREKALIQGDDDPHKLFLGPLIADLAFTDWNYIKVSRLAQPIIDGVRDHVDATVFLGVRVRTRVMITATAEARESFRISAPAGTTIPLFAGAAGKVFLALESAERIGELLGEKGLPQYTSHSILNVEDYLAELQRVRSRGYAIDDEEYLSGIRAVAAALHNRRGLPMAIWVVGIASNMGMTRLRQVADITVAAAGNLRSRLEGVEHSSSGVAAGGGDAVSI
jgi:DNA-binding IclR family transcriptional regulator